MSSDTQIAYKFPLEHPAREKYVALLIAQYDLEAHHFCSEDERQRLILYIDILESMLSKLQGLEKQA
jgi:hypothetical protein